MPDRDAIRARAVVGVGVVILAVVGAVVIAVFVFLRTMGDPPGGPLADAASAVSVLQAASAPVLQTAPQDDLAAMRAAAPSPPGAVR